MTEEAVEKKKPSDEWSFEGICHMFAKASVAHAKMAYDNMVLGHNDAANMILRAFIENCVSFEVIFDHEEEANHHQIPLPGVSGNLLRAIVYNNRPAMYQMKRKRDNIVGINYLYVA